MGSEYFLVWSTSEFGVPPSSEYRLQAVWFVVPPSGGTGSAREDRLKAVPRTAPRRYCMLMKRVLAIVLATACGSAALYLFTRPTSRERDPAPQAVAHPDAIGHPLEDPAQASEATALTESDRVALQDTEPDASERAALPTDPDVIAESIPSPATIVGRIVDERENLPATEMWVRARKPNHGREPAIEQLARVQVDPTTHEFMLASLPPGALELVLELPHWPSLQQRKVDVLAGSRTEVELAYDGRDLNNAIWVLCEPAKESGSTADDSFQPTRDHVRLLADAEPQGEPVRYRGVFLFKRFAPGFHQVLVDDPRFLPVRIDGLQTGEGVSVALVGSSAIRLHVLDAASGSTIPRYRAWLDTAAPGAYDQSFQQIQEEDRPPPPDGVYAGIGPGWSELVVADERGRRRIPLDGRVPVGSNDRGHAGLPSEVLVAGAILEVEVTLGTTHTLRGTALDEANKPIAGLELYLEEPTRDRIHCAVKQAPLYEARVVELPSDLVTSQILPWCQFLEVELAPGRVVAQGRSSADGTFSLGNVPSGTWILRTASNSHVSKLFAIDVNGEDRSGIELRLAPGGRWNGCFLAPPRIDLEKCHATIATAPIEIGDDDGIYLDIGDPIAVPKQAFPDPLRELEVGADTLTLSIDRNGRVRTPPLPAGKYSVNLVLPDGSILETEGIELEAGQILERDFDVASLLPG